MSNTNGPTPSRSALLSFTRDMKRKEKKLEDEQQGIEGIDARYAELATMPGWKDLKKYMNDIKKMLRPSYQFEDDMSDDDFFKSFGMRTLIHDIVADYLDQVIDRVENAKEVVDEKRGEK